MIAIVAALFCSAQDADAKTIDEHFFLVPAGKVDKRVNEKLKERLAASWPVPVKIEIDPALELPQSAYDSARNQYNAQAFIDALAERITIAKTDERALIVTDADLYTPDLNFVFGLADQKKGLSVISLARLRNEFYGQKPDERLFIDRAVKEAVHELGHARGLEHCPKSKCVMFFSNSLADTDKKRGELCYDCRTRLERSYGGSLFGSVFDKI